MKKMLFVALAFAAGSHVTAQAAEVQAANANAQPTVKQMHTNDTWNVSSNGIRHPLLDGEPQTGANWDYSSAHDVDGYAVPRS
ncbi:hypothetical protein [Paraburkholderia flagellata]|uniref:hypothetical protein n=1 Tax=Paraburkholderia flagellata TaxID=2883241 RepID=UPI001F26FD54|nr:hypothetical protein [Paraburkholderia flagellata]